jgi:hypothetical protein
MKKVKGGLGDTATHEVGHYQRGGSVKPQGVRDVSDFDISGPGVKPK